MNFAQTAGLFNVGDTHNVSQGALNNFLPMANAQNSFSNALQQLAQARIGNQQQLQMGQLGMGQRELQDMSNSMQINPTDLLSLGLSGYGALQGINSNQTAKNYGYLPNPNLPTPQLGGY